MINYFFSKEGLFFLAATLWNIYDSYDCLINGYCGWKNNIYIPDFSIWRILYLFFNIFFQALLLGGLIMYFQINNKVNKGRRKNKSIKDKKV